MQACFNALVKFTVAPHILYMRPCVPTSMFSSARAWLYALSLLCKRTYLHTRQHHYMDMYRRLQPAGRYHVGLHHCYSYPYSVLVWLLQQPIRRRETACVHTITNTTRGACVLRCFRESRTISQANFAQQGQSRQPPMAWPHARTA